MTIIYGISVSRVRVEVTIQQAKNLIRDIVTGGTSVNDVKKLIAEMLNLASVDPDEIVVFGDRQGKLKTSYVSLGEIFVKRRDAIENALALFSSDGKLKPDVLFSTITDKLSDTI